MKVSKSNNSAAPTVIDNRIPVIVIGGFLGAGKTTLLNRVLTEDHGLRAAVLVNDFGPVNVDSDLIIDIEGETISFANGCICCTIRDDLAGACLELANGPNPPDLLLIELSGVSEPGPVLNVFGETLLGSVFELSCMVTLADADRLSDLPPGQWELIRSQLMAADLVVLNKVDLVNSQKLDRARNRIRSVIPKTPVLESVRGQIELKLLLGSEFQHYQIGDNPRDISAHELEHIQSISTAIWRESRPLSVEKLRSVLDNLPANVVRCKGFIQFEEFPAYRFLLQMVGRRYEFIQSGNWGDQKPGSELVSIAFGNNLDDKLMREWFEHAVGSGDETVSPLLRLVRKVAPDLAGIENAQNSLGERTANESISVGQ